MFRAEWGDESTHATGAPEQREHCLLCQPRKSLRPHPHSSPLSGLAFLLGTPDPGGSVLIQRLPSLKWRSGLVAIPKALDTSLPTVTPNPTNMDRKKCPPANSREQGQRGWQAGSCQSLTADVSQPTCLKGNQDSPSQQAGKIAEQFQEREGMGSCSCMVRSTTGTGQSVSLSPSPRLAAARCSEWKWIFLQQVYPLIETSLELKQVHRPRE